MPYPSKKFRQNPFTTFSVIRRTDRQTDRQTDRSENITSFFGGGNNGSTQIPSLLLNHWHATLPYSQYGGRVLHLNRWSMLRPGNRQNTRHSQARTFFNRWLWRPSVPSTQKASHSFPSWAADWPTPREILVTLHISSREQRWGTWYLYLYLDVIYLFPLKC